MRISAKALPILLLALLPQACNGSWITTEGQSPFEMQAIPLDTAVRSGNFSVLVNVVWHGGGTIGAEANLKLPPGLTRIDGEAQRRLVLRRDHPEKWRLVLKASQPGQYVIRGTLRIQRPGDGGLYQGQYETRLEVGADEVRGSTVENGSEMTLGGKRYGYGGLWLVLLEPGDPLTNGVDLSPVVLQQEDAICDECPDSVVVPFVVTVGRDGKIRWPRLDPSDRDISPRVLAAAENALRDWRYEPASSHGRAVAYWAVARVMVRSRSR